MNKRFGVYGRIYIDKKLIIIIYIDISECASCFCATNIGLFCNQYIQKGNNNSVLSLFYKSTSSPLVKSFLI